MCLIGARSWLTPFKNDIDKAGSLDHVRLVDRPAVDDDRARLMPSRVALCHSCGRTGTLSPAVPHRPSANAPGTRLASLHRVDHASGLPAGSRQVEMNATGLACSAAIRKT